MTELFTILSIFYLSTLLFHIMSCNHSTNHLLPTLSFSSTLLYSTLLYSTNLALLKKQWQKEAKEREKELRKELAGKSGGAGISMSELTKSNSGDDNGFKRPMATQETQTEVDECGVWDKQDGWTLPICGTLIARQRWRKAIKFSQCPACHGIGAFIATAARLLKAMQRGGGNQLVDENKKPKGKTGAVWQIPDDLVRFMSNLPRSVMAISPKPLPWVIRRVWHLLEKKYDADDADENQGLPLQSVEEHMIEAYLIRSEKRSDAELEIFVLLTTLKEHHHRHMLLHTYSRFIGVLDGYSVEYMKQIAEEKGAEKTKRKEKELKAKYKNMSSRERTAAARAEEDAARQKAEREIGKAEPQETLGKCDASLSLAILKVYHFARHCLLEPYHGGYAPMIAQVKINCKFSFVLSIVPFNSRHITSHHITSQHTTLTPLAHLPTYPHQVTILIKIVIVLTRNLSNGIVISPHMYVYVLNIISIYRLIVL